MLPSELNPFGGRVIDADELPEDPDEFGALLLQSIRTWTEEGAKVVWLRLPLDRAAHVPIAVGAGFVYHHATEDAVQLTLTLIAGSYVPPFATHYIGAGGIVLWSDPNSRQSPKLLVVSEADRKRRHYKLPGGALHPGEHIVDAVLREVKEETGIDTEFQSLVCFRHWHGYRHGKSDIYFVCRLTPLSFEIQRDEFEISECLWMPVDEYLIHPDVHTFNRRIVRAALGRPGSDPPAVGVAPDGRASGATYGGASPDGEDSEKRANLGLVPVEIEGYGTRATHEFFMPE